ncbi:T9SS type A sorting domain-containing protein [Flavobacterium zepuense]|uniref:T9SS type A sorting domain-containing protein n=1 Tax=Flavobacterium zepuense TaxID=2593302 RepID=A0A552V408_9FLAO|nr:T9SS type A sorting domain-containing protein [Flavobacterium zepuense]TRW25206.1 T9SS type A sorting domain-containing protein [Flavobacterium zepuense]
MKTTFLVLFLCVTSCIDAQTVIFADPELKDDILFYQPELDVNNDGEIQVDEAQSATHLSLSANYYSSVIGIEAFTHITSLFLHVLSLTELDLSSFQNIKDLNLRTSVATIDVSMLPTLENFTIFASSTSNVITGYMPNLKTIDFLQAPIVSLDLTGAENLETAFLDSYLFNDLQIGYKPHLKYLYVWSTSLTNLDLSQCTALIGAEINLGNASHDVHVNLKNGDTDFAEDYMDFVYITDGNPLYHCYICIDEGEEVTFTENSFAPWIFLSPYCTFEPGGSHNTITGSLYLNESGSCEDATELLGYSSITINGNSEVGTVFSNSNVYKFYPGAGTYTLTPQVNTSLFEVNPATASVSFLDNNDNTSTQNFCLTPIGTHPDVEIALIPLQLPQPGFNAVYKIVYTNKGNQTLSGNIIFTYDDALLDYVSATSVESSANIGEIIWSYSDLQFYESREILLTLNVNSPMETPPVNINDVLNLTAVANPIDGDMTPGNNTFALKQTVVGSYDPNDITCLQGSLVNPDKIGDYLHYNINFENTGTAPATFIVVKDIIDAAKYDIASLQLINVSHNMEARVTGNKAEFIFNNINLAAGGKGNVLFKIKTLGTLSVNSEVTQQADIYFDYNWPVLTNEANTVFGVLNTRDFVVDQSVKIYPNPANAVINIQTDSAINSMQLYDIQGRLLQAISGNGNKAIVDVSGRAKGLYFLKITTEKGTKVEKVMVE